MTVECMHLRGGAGIPPEPQLTQTQKRIVAQLGFSVGTTSLVSAQAFLQNIGHWLAVRKETGIVLLPHRTTHPRYPSEVCAADRYSVQSVSPLDGYLFEDDWEMVPHNQPSFEKNMPVELSI